MTQSDCNHDIAAKNLLKLMVEVKDMLKKDWKVVVIAFTSDASGESRKAW